MVPGGAHVGEADLCGRGAADFELRGSEGEAFTQQRTGDDDEFGRHPWWFSVSGAAVNRRVREPEQHGSEFAGNGAPPHGVSTTCELAGRLHFYWPRNPE